MNNKQYYIGIDPGLKTSGVALVNPDNREMILTNLTLKALFNVILNQDRVVLECPLLDSLVFPSHINKRKDPVAAKIKIAQKVGANKAVAALIVDELIRSGKPFAVVAPSDRVSMQSRTVKTMLKTTAMNDDSNLKRYLSSLRYPTKTTRKQFELLTGYTEHNGNNEHSRDAATLVYKMNPASFDLLQKRTKAMIKSGALKI